MATIKNFFPLLFAALLFACGEKNTTDFGGVTPQIVFTHAHVIPMNGEQVLEDQTVVIGDGKILAIGSSAEISFPDSARVIDASGQYLMPGLAEMHAHIPVPREGQEDVVEETLFLYLSNGVTTIRGMLGDPFHLDLKTRVAKEEVISPRIFTSGPSLNGNTVPDLKIADSTVRAQKAAGYDFMKLHPGIKREVFDQIIATAKEVGMPYAGHVSIHVGIRHALESDYASVDHIDGYLEGLVPESAGVKPEENGFFGFNFTHLADTTLIPELVDLTLAHKVAVVPTQGLLVRWTSTDKPENTIAEPEMKYMSPRTREQWVQSKFGLQRLENYDSTRVSEFIGIRKKILKALHVKGVLLVLGSDAPQVFNVPGFSIQHELAAMNDAGLTPYECLVTGTVNAAKYFGREGEFGVVAQGSSADLILLDKNPLGDLAHLKNPAGVMYRGKWLSREDIQSRLEAIAAKYE
ncbi:MAG: amidohydrolase family protein [Bacteroidia bacterium]|nr:amidohydrolase family protein [Bacteroidia bacterium]